MAVTNKAQAAKSLDGKALTKAFRDAAAYVGERKAQIDALNVFPVPDGDTGTNMYLTMNSAVKEMDKYPAEKIGEVANSIALGCLMGARGNSGVIFSQLMRGYSTRLKGKKVANTADIAEALMEASNMAYKAVIKPVEGTILTVSRAAGKQALEAYKSGAEVIDIYKAALEAAEISLEKTPDLLPVLKEAGVVDAGGKGYVFFLEGIIASLEGVQIAPVIQAASAVEKRPEEKKELTHIEFRYCTEFIIKGENLDEEKIRRDIEMMGDSMLVVGIPETMKVHIHSNNPGKVLEKVIKFGTLHEIHINNMADQHEDFVMPEFQKNPAAVAVNGHSHQTAETSKATDVRQGKTENRKQAETKPLATVAVAAGEGLRDIFSSLGVDECVTGGQTLNPSIKEIADAIEATGGKEVIVLPNNKNVILTARQAVDVVKAKVHVIPSKSMQQGISAMMGFNPEAAVAENVERMTKGISSVVSGEITYAVRDTKLNGIEVRQDDFIGIIDGQLLITGAELEEVLDKTVDRMLKKESEIITVFYGSEIEQKTAEEAAARLQGAYPQLSVELHSGGQPVYYYLVAVE